MADLGYLKRHGTTGAELMRMAALHTDVTEVGGVAERARVRELILSHYLPADPDAVTEAEWAERAGQGFSGTTTAGRDGLRRTLPPAAGRGPLGGQGQLLEFGQRLAELFPGADAELGEDLVQVPLDRAPLMNSRPPICVLVCPSPASRAIWASCAVSSLAASRVRLRTVSPVASSSRRARSANPSKPISVSIW